MSESMPPATGEPNAHQVTDAVRAARPYRVTDPLPTGTVVLEASAGTGKTFTISALAARHVAEGVHRLDEMMMVTFSRAATRELRSRIVGRLRQSRDALSQWLATGVQPGDEVDQLLCAGSRDEVERRLARLTEALADSDAATITTTHEFCARMLSELGLLVDHDDTDRFVHDLTDLETQVIRDCYLATFPQGGPRLDEALTLGRVVLRRGDLPLAEPGSDAASQVRHGFAQQVRREFDRRKRLLGVYTFDDMVSRLRAALQHPVTGPAACRELAERFPLVMIDEFQDTDLAQWQIVEAAFVGRSTVVLIGDPKQAIYSFRDADVLAYLNAVQSADALLTLPLNHRSDPGVVEGVQALFGGAALGEPRISVRPVRPARPAPTLRRHGADAGRAVEVRCLPVDPAARRLPPVARVREVLHADMTRVVAQYLDTTWQVDDADAPSGVRPLDAGDIAVLVRTNAAGRRVQQALADAGIDAVFSGADTVFSSPAAGDWQVTLQALVDPSPAHLAQAALGQLIGWSLDAYADAATGSSAAALDDLAFQVRALQRTLRERGVAAVFEAVLDRFDVAERILSRRGGEREFTDLRHVAELLNDAQLRQRLGPAALLRWLEERIDEARGGDDGDRTRRLETDRRAVRIMTVHRAKGLEFPVVLVPDAADLFSRSNDTAPAVAFQDGSGRRLDVGSGVQHRRRAQALDAESRDEELRTAYVAFTRARSRLVVWWGASRSNTESSPLHRIAVGGFAPGETPPASVPASRSPLDVAAENPGRFASEHLAIVEVDPAPPAQVPAPASTLPLLQVRRFDRTIDQAWRRTSYTGLTAGAHEVASLVGVPVVHDEPDLVDEALLDEVLLDGDGPSELAGTPILEDVSAAPDPLSRVGALAPLPGGTDFGTLVHAVLEHVDPHDGLLDDAVAAAVDTWLDRLPLDGVPADALTKGLVAAFRTPLGTLAGGRTLADFGVRDRLAELDFELPMAPRTSDAASLTDLAAALADADLTGGDDFADAYAEHLRESPVAGTVLAGFLTGSIDAVLRFPAGPDKGDARPGDSRFLVVDYKTNRVPVSPGEALTVGHYARPSMAEAMIHAHYPLQALLYCVALHRHLSWRMPGYDPERHLAGVGYLFVRGMDGPDTPVVDGTTCGVFTWTPSARLVERASAILSGVALPTPDASVTGKGLR